jgi:hypothetical protein
MPQDQSQSTAPVQPKTPVTPAAKTAPLPLDPKLLRHVGGGGSTTRSPNGSW